MTAEPRGTLGTVRNAMLLLDLMSEGPAYRQLSDLAQESGLSLPTVHRLLRSLVLAELVEQDGRTSRYGLGPELTRLSQRYLARLPVLGALAPYLVPLRDALGGTVQVAILVRGSVVYVDRVDGTTASLYRETGRTVPALSTAAGQVLGARADDASWAAALERAEPDFAARAQERRTAWAAADHLVSGGAGSLDAIEVAVPVLDGGGRAAAALSVTCADPGTSGGTGTSTGTSTGPSTGSSTGTGGDSAVGGKEAGTLRADPATVAQLQQAARAAGRTLGHG